MSELKHFADVLLPWRLTSYAPTCFTFEKFLESVWMVEFTPRKERR